MEESLTISEIFRDVSTPLDMTTEMTVMQVLAPAKINLSLRILNRRADGFHEIETFVVPISLCDEIEIEEQSIGIDFSCDDPSVPSGHDNLAVRAAKAFFAASGVKAGVSIKLHKRIPQSAGLGGGSSDAASTLLALNELFGNKMSGNELSKIGATIGSDVPFFLVRSPAICRGRGEIVSPTELAEKLSVLLFKPDFGVSAGWAYAQWQQSRELPGVNYGTQEFSGQRLVNHLERPVLEKFVFLAELKMWLLKQNEVGAALMSGSGSTIFAMLNDSADSVALAERAKQNLDPNLWTCACETL
jgi:4-diphosphocytidyl-2-C-methyl-D-erythritol kinase